MKKLATIFLIIWGVGAYASAPQWSINPNNFEHSMQINCVAVLNGNELRSTSDLIGAFVDDECRGLTNPVYIPSIDRYIFYLSVMSNSTSGENLKFKIYNSQSDNIANADNTIQFQANHEIGSALAPYSVSNLELTNGLKISTLEFNENISSESSIALLETWYNGRKVNASYSLTNLFGDNSAFEILGNNLIANAIFNYEQKSEYSVKIESVGEGGTFTETFILKVLDVNEAPTLIELSSLNADENLPSGTVISTLSAIDEDSNEMFVYSTSNENFSISGNRLILSGKLNYEIKKSETVVIQVIDKGNNIYSQQFSITVNDVNDAPSSISLIGNEAISGLPGGIIIGALAAKDEDIDDILIFSRDISKDDNRCFSIDSRNFLIADSTFSTDEASQRKVSVTVTDAEGAKYTETFTIDIVDRGYIFSQKSVKVTFSTSDITVHNREINDHSVQIEITPLNQYSCFEINSDVKIIEFNLINLQGKILEKKAVNNWKFKINTTNLSTGTYYLSLLTEYGPVTESILISEN